MRRAGKSCNSNHDGQISKYESTSLQSSVIHNCTFWCTTYFLTSHSSAATIYRLDRFITFRCHVTSGCDERNSKRLEAVALVVAALREHMSRQSAHPAAGQEEDYDTIEASNTSPRDYQQIELPKL